MSEVYVYSIFGQVEEAVANAMIEEGKLVRINNDPATFPLAVRYNELGHLAKFAVLVPRKMMHEFEHRIDMLYN